MSAILFRSARPMMRSTAALLPARRLITSASAGAAKQPQQSQQHAQSKQAAQHEINQQSQQQSQQASQQEGNVWATPVSTPLKAAAGGVVADVVGAAAEIKNNIAAKISNNNSMGELKEKAAQLGEKAKSAAAAMSQQLGDIIDPENAGQQQQDNNGQGKHTSTSSRRATTDLEEDATRMVQKVQNRSTQVGVEIKEQGQSMMHKAKKTVRKVGEAVSDAVSDAAEGVATEVAPKSSFANGPQTMSQGVGKRAVDAEGKPLETGAPRT